MMKIAEKYFKIGCIFVLIIVLAMIFQRYPYANRSDQSQNYERFESSWQCGSESISFPYMQYNTGEAVIMNTLPKVNDDDKLILRASFIGIRVYVAEQQIYEYMTKTNTLDRLRGDLYLYVPLTEEYSNQPIRIELVNDNAFNGGLSAVMIGNEASFMADMRSYYAPNYIILIMILMFGFSLLGIAAYLDIKKKNMDYRIFLYLGVFSLISAVWIWTDSPLYHINISTAVSVAMLSFISFMAIPLPIVAFVKSICVKPKKSLQIMSNVLFLNILIQPLLYIFGYADFIQMLPFTHLLLILSVILMTHP